MASWSDFAAAAPDLAERVQRSFTVHRHHTMATIRLDGSPRISGTEIEFADGQLRLGMMKGSRRAADLRRDPRLAVHAHTVDPNPDDHTDWVGEAKLCGLAREVQVRDDADGFDIDLTEVVFTSIGDPPDHLVIERWTASGGLTRVERR